MFIIILIGIQYAQHVNPYHCQSTGEYIVKEVEALYALKKYRAIFKKYNYDKKSMQLMETELATEKWSWAYRNAVLAWNSN